MFRKKKVNKLCLETLECRLAPAVSLMGDINTTPENSIPSKDIFYFYCNLDNLFN